MTVAVADYAEIFEREFRPRRVVRNRLRRLGVLAVWAGLFAIRPKLALDILRER